MSHPSRMNSPRATARCRTATRRPAAVTGLTGIVLVILVSALASPAEAQTSPPERSGFWATVGLGYGSLGSPDFNDREDGLSGNLTLGGTISPRFLLGGGTNGWTKDFDGTRVTFSTLTVMARFYPNADGGFFLNGGLGAGQASVSQGSSSVSESGGGAILGLGYDARVGDRWYLTPFANSIGFSFDGESWNVFQFGLGMSYH